MTPHDLKATYFTLGCKLNFAETSTMAAKLAEHGIRNAARGETADVVLVNTCSVTEVADAKCRQAIHRLVRQNPGAFVVITGCYAQLQRELLQAIDGVALVEPDKGQVVDEVLRKMGLADAVSGAAEGNDGASAGNSGASAGNSAAKAGANNARRISLNDFVPSCSRGNRTRYFLKVQDGCDYFCSYCTIPMARGRSRNGSIDSLVAQASEVASSGGKEIVITGVNIGDFGRTTGETFLDLCRALDQVEGIQRYRISSIEPNLLTDEIISFAAQSRAFMPHFHIPLQCGSDEVLRLMRRRYDTALFRHKVECIKQAMPHAFIGVDVIVGMRGETDELFCQSRDFLASLPVTQLHVFSYSERPGTKALSITPVVSPEEKHARSQQLLQLSEQKLAAFYGEFRGQARPVLLEHAPAKPLMKGFTDNYIRVEIPNHPQLANQIVPVALGDWNDKHDALQGTLADHATN